MAIAESCRLILSNVVSVQEGFASLALNVSAANASPIDKRDFAKKHEELHGGAPPLLEMMMMMMMVLAG